MRAGCAPWRLRGRAGGLLPAPGESRARSRGCLGGSSCPSCPTASGLAPHGDPALGGEEPQLGCSLGMVRWCQPCSQNWMGQGRAEEELGAFSFHTWETVKSQVATPAFVWYFQKNPAGPGIPGHNLLWKNKIIKYQSL